MMRIGKLQNSHENFGGCRSAGSNFHPSSQSQKMSIGIVVDSTHKVQREVSLGAKWSEPPADHSRTPINKNSAEAVLEKQDVIRPITGKETNCPDQERSPWIMTKDKTPALKNLIHEKEASTSYSMPKYKLNGFPLSDFVTSFTKHASSYSKSKNHHLKPVIMEQATDEPVPAKIVTEDKSVNTPSIALKMKLLEILGPDTLPEDQLIDNHDQSRKTDSVSNDHVKNQKSDSKEFEKCDNLPDKDHLNEKQDLTRITGSVSGDCVNNQKAELEKVEQNVNDTIGNHAETCYGRHTYDAAFKSGIGSSSKINKSGIGSDPIETDSGSPDNIIKRPVTRSFTRKRGPSKSLPKKADNRLSHSYQQRKKDATVKMGGNHWSNVSKSTSLLSGVKRKEKNSARIEPRKISFFESIDTKAKASTYANSPIQLQALDKTPGVGDKGEGSEHGSPLNDQEQIIPKKSRVHKTRFHKCMPPNKAPSLSNGSNRHQHSPPNDLDQIMREMGNQQRGLQFTVAKHGANPSDNIIHPKQKGTGNATSEKILEPLENLRTSTLKTTAPRESTSPRRAEKTENVRGHDTAAVSEEKKFTGVKDDTTDLEVEGSPAGKSPTSSRKLASDDCNSGSSEDNSLLGARCNDVTEKEINSSPEAPTASLRFFPHGGKRPRSLQATKYDKYSKIFTPPNDSSLAHEEDDVLCAASLDDEDDSLSRAVTLLAVALKNVKSKMKIAATKKSSEILHSTAEGLNLQLRSVKSRIQTDIEKVTGIGKSKRKHMETMFDEQQEQLKVLHENFNKALSQHLQDTISTIEGMETDQAELRSVAEKQKALHKKLLLEVEEEMETQLNDAHKRITNVQEVSNKKLLLLKHVIAECLK